MTRNDQDGDNAGLTPNDALGDVHATLPVRVKDLNKWAILARGNADIEQAKEIEFYIRKPRLVTVDLDELNKWLANWFDEDTAELSRELRMDLIERLEASE